MQSKKIYIVRHGQTDYNLNGIVQGSGIDSSLNETGRAQAEAFYQAYKGVPFDRVYTSDLKRTHQSVKRFLEDGFPTTALSGLNEINWGTREGIKITPEDDVYYHQVIQSWRDGNTDLRIEGGESPEDVQTRQKVALDHILAQKEEDTILVCMHGRAIRIFLCLLLNKPLKTMDSFEHTNLCLYLVTYTGSMFNIESFNDTRHLNGKI